jgi:transmembrane sensor
MMGKDRWHAFTAWLEADPAHAAAYDAVAIADRHLAMMRRDMVARDSDNPAPVPSRNPLVRPLIHFTRKPVWIGAACAASLVAVLLVGATMQAGRPDSHYAVATPAGTSRTIAMGDGSSVALNGATRMAFDRDEPRTARLDEGEALFSVRHDADKPFTVEVGRFRIEDLGTVFNIVREKGRLSISVAEGRILFDPEGANLTLGAGEAVTIDEGVNSLTRSKAMKVGGWQHGDMEFSETPLGEVASAIHRRTGAEIMVAAPLSNTPFTGNIRISGEAGNDARHLANLVGANLHRDGEKWLLSSKAAAD